MVTVLPEPCHPHEAAARKHSIRAVVIDHPLHHTGILWWKQTFPCVKVRILDEDYVTLREIIRDECKDCNGRAIGSLPQEILIGYSQKDEHLRWQFSVGEEVHLHFSTFGAIQQFYHGAPAHRWDRLEKKQAQAA